MALHSSGSPSPPLDFAGRELPLETILRGKRLARIHHRDFDPIHFGSSEYNRFDDQRRDFGVCYRAMNHEGAFAETVVRGADNGVIQESYVQERSISELAVTATLRLSSLHGPGLARVGATSAVASGSHDVARKWERAIYDHPAVPDGIAYRSKHDDDEICIALFDRAQQDRFAPAGDQKPMMMELNDSAEFCALYGLGLR